MEFTDVWRDWARFVFFGNSAESAEWSDEVLRNRLAATWDQFSRHGDAFKKCPRCGYQSPVASQEELRERFRVMTQDPDPS